MIRFIRARSGWRHRDGWVVAVSGLLLAAILCVVASVRPFNNSPDIRSDGVGYHAWVHAIVHGDLTFCRYEAMLRDAAAISGKSEDGTRCRNKYPPGVGLLQLPFSLPVLAAHPAQTGFSASENDVVRWGGAVLLLATAGFLYAVLARRRVPPTMAVLAVGAFVFGTGLFHYATYDASFSHVYSAFGIALLMWLTLDRPVPSPRDLVACLVVAAWLYLVRQTNAALTLGVIYIAIRESAPPVRWRLGAAWFTGTGIAAVALLAYGFYMSRALSVSSYGNEGFPSFAGHLREVLASYERGLFTYYPVFFLVTVLALWRLSKPVSQVFLALVGIFALLYGSWHAWHLGGGFGHRGFVEIAPFGVLVLGDALARWSARARWIAGAAVVVCCAVTMLAMAAYWRGDLPFHGVVPPQYWRAVSPVSLFVDNRFTYTKSDVGRVTLSVEGTEHRADGQWVASVRVHNGNPSTVIYADSTPGLSLSWRVVAPGDAPGAGWDTRAPFPGLQPGESKVVTVIVPPPDSAVAGQTLQFSFVEDGLFWAHDIGVAPVVISWGPARAASDNKLD